VRHHRLHHAPTGSGAGGASLFAPAPAGALARTLAAPRAPWHHGGFEQVVDARG
jgi:hypothetical protein